MEFLVVSKFEKKTEGQAIEELINFSKEKGNGH